MTLFEQDEADARLQHAHTRFTATAATTPEEVSPVRVVLGVVRGGFAIGRTALRARHGIDPIALRPRVLGV